MDGENPPPGAIIDYYLPTAAAGEVKLEILDTQGKVLRTYSSSDPVPPDPARDLAGYDKLCQQTPGAPHCGLPLYWPAPAQILSREPGMHRFTWDLRYAPVLEGAAGGVDEGAVPHRTYTVANAPWAPPGSYSVRLTAGTQRLSQPLRGKRFANRQRIGRFADNDQVAIALLEEADRGVEHGVPEAELDEHEQDGKGDLVVLAGEAFQRACQRGHDRSTLAREGTR